MYEHILKSCMGEKRFRHCLNVSKSAAILAQRYGADVEKARIAGLLHDITKERTYSEQMAMVKKFGIVLSKFDVMSKKLLHAMTGSCYIEKVLGINDPDIISAVRYHTTARSGMSVLEKIVFVADCISDDRKHRDVSRQRKAAEKSLDLAMLECIKSCLKDLIESGKPVHPNIYKSFNDFATRKEGFTINMDSENTAKKICEILDNKKAIDVNKTCTEDISSLADYFIFATGSSSTHVKSLADELKIRLSKERLTLKRREEDSSGSWILLDYGDVIVHIFTDNVRKLYNIEKIFDNKKENKQELSN